MAAKLKFILLYFISWVLFFDLLRLVFLVYHADKTKTLSFSTIANTFFYGLRMDISVSAYIVAPICLFVLLSLFIHFFRRLLIYKVYTLLILFIVCLICLADLEIYQAWGFRIDSTPFRFLGTPKEAFASVSHLPLFWILILFLLAYGLFFFCFRFILRRIFFQQQNKHHVITGIVLLLLMGSLIIPIRGGLQLAPLNQSSVYFSTNNFANHAAINASWNLLHSAFSKGSSGKNPYKYMDMATAKTITDSLFQPLPADSIYVNFHSGQPTNVLLVIWESFTEKAIHVTRDGQAVTPVFNDLISKGIYFSNVYASGDRTNKGIPAILSGYPAMNNTTIIHNPAKSAKLSVLSKEFQQQGYKTSFYYGGEPEFANIKSYLLHAGFDPIIGKDDFSQKQMNSKWGAHDGVVAQRLLKDLNTSTQPFFTTWLTLSSHEPFETPLETVIKGNDNTSKFLNSIHYTDKVLGHFINEAEKQPWWNNTVVIIIGDHGHPLPETEFKADDFRTPMLWLGGALQKKGIKVDKIVSQLDIASMLAAQAGWKQGDFPFSRNSLSASANGWAFFTFNDGFGFVDSTGCLTFDNVGKRIIEQEGDPGPAQLRWGQALQQVLFEDFLRK